MPTYTPNYGLAKPLVNNATDQDLWGGELNGDMDIIDTQLKVNADAIAAIATVPVATVSPYAGTAAPSGWLFCYGQILNVADYPALFAAMGGTYGGNGVTTFGIPDLRGRVVAGQDDMGGTSANRLTGQPGGVNGDILGNAGGNEVHTLTVPEIPSHDHPPVAGLYVVSGLGDAQTPLAGSGATTFSSTASTGGGGAHNNVQPTFILNYIIKT